MQVVQAAQGQSSVRAGAEEQERTCPGVVLRQVCSFVPLTFPTPGVVGTARCYQLEAVAMPPFSI